MAIVSVCNMFKIHFSNKLRAPLETSAQNNTDANVVNGL